MRRHPHTMLRPVVAALALLAAGCGDNAADPVVPGPGTAASPEAPVLVEPEPALKPEPSRLLEPEPRQEPEPQPTTAQPAQPEPQPTTAQPAQPEPQPTTAQPAQPEPQPTTAQPAEPEPQPTTAQPTEPEPQPTTTQPAQPEPEPQPATAQPAEPEPQQRPEPESDDPASSDAEAVVESAPRQGPEDPAEPEPQLAPCPEGQHRHGDEPCHYDDPEPEPVQAEPQLEPAIVEIEDEPDSDEVHPHTTDTVPDPLPASGVFPSARGEQPTVAWQVHVSGIVEGSRPLPAFTAAVQGWSDWCFFDWATRHPDTQGARQQCAIQLSLIGMATELLGISDQCATRQYRGQLEMITGEGEFDFATDFGRVGWHACPSAIDADPADDIPSPYFDADLYAASLMPDDDCMRASWAAEVYLQQHGIWMAEWRC